MTLTGVVKDYYIARTNTATNEDSVLRMNSYSGLFSSSNDFEGATKYPDFESANKIVQLQNMLAQVTGQAYEYYVIETVTDSFRVDDEGNRAPDEDQPNGEATDEVITEDEVEEEPAQ